MTQSCGGPTLTRFGKYRVILLAGAILLRIDYGLKSVDTVPL
jgi:hypothetical protein